MKNFEIFKRIVSRYDRDGVRVQEDRSCWSSLFPCFGSEAPAPAQDRLRPDQSAFLIGIKHVALKIVRGEEVRPSDFRGNVQVSRHDLVGEKAPLLAKNPSDTNSLREESRTSDQLIQFKDFIPAMSNPESREGVFKLFLHAVYHYLDDLREADVFTTHLMRNFESNYDFVVSDEIAKGDNAIACLALIKNAIQNNIPLQTRPRASNTLLADAPASASTPSGNGESQGGAGALGDIKQVRRGTDAVPTSPAAPAEPFVADSLGTSYQYQRSAKK